MVFEMLLGQSNGTIQSGHDDPWTNSAVSCSPKFSAQIAEGIVSETTYQQQSWCIHPSFSSQRETIGYLNPVYAPGKLKIG